MADISVVTARVIEGERLHRLRIENAHKGQLNSFLLVPRNLRPLHCAALLAETQKQTVASQFLLERS